MKYAHLIRRDPSRKACDDKPLPPICERPVSSDDGWVICPKCEEFSGVETLGVAVRFTGA